MFRKIHVRKHMCQLLVLVMMLCLLTPIPVLAAPDATTSDGIYTSMYDVSTALTAYANSVVGSNTNDKHDTHELDELHLGSVKPGVAGAFIGYGDDDKGFYAYISSNTAKSVTTSSYDAWFNAGDDGALYAYTRYGHLLADLGLDETGNATESSVGRSAFGLFMQGSHAISAFVPKIFDTSLIILKTLNPFQFFSGDTAVKDAITSGSLSDVENTVDGAGNTVEFKQPTGNNELDANQEIGTSAAFQKLIQYVSDIYKASQKMGTFVVFPMMLVIFLCAMLFKRDFRGWQAFAFKVVFMFIGVPLCGIMYTAVLNDMTTVTQSTPAASRLVACTFVDFQSWVTESRLDLPNDVVLTSVGIDSEDGDSITAAGSAHNDSVRQLRNITYTINRKLYGFPANFKLGIIAADGSYEDVITNPGIWRDDGVLRNNITNSSVEKLINALLQRYRSGDFYHASTWETAVNGSIVKHHKANLGQIPSTSNATTNEGKVYQMYDETNDVSDWMNRTVDDNKKILRGDLWSAFNIFSNGLLKVTYGANGIAVDEHIEFLSSEQSWGDKTNPSTKGGLSSVAMYNYLCTSFDDSAISVYSAQKSTSEYTKLAHYSVNLIGSGALRVAYGLNCIACLFSFALIGVIYGFGMVIGNIKRGIHLIMQIPFAVMGVVRSIVQVFIYVFVMCIELIFSVFAYRWVCELIVLFASIIESPIEDAVASVSTILIGGRFAFVADYISPSVLYDNRMLFTCGMFVLVFGVMFFNYLSVKFCRNVLTAYEYAVCCYLRLVTLDEMLPVFDAWMASRNSLYVWNRVSETKNSVSETTRQLCAIDINLQKGVSVL